MRPAHGGEHGAYDVGALIVVAAVVMVAAAYVALTLRLSSGRPWDHRRTLAFVVGCALLVAGLVPGLSPFPDGDFRGHMHQHLLLGMYAPLGLVLGAPMTLLLRSVPVGVARRLSRLLRSAPMRVLAHPVTGLVLSVGGMWVLYVTPLFSLTQQHPALHHLVHVHFVLAGCLFAYGIAGPDPAPHRPSVPARLVILGVAIAGHAVLAQVMYAGWVPIPVPAQELRGAADLMYYGGDIGELILAFALVATWRRAPRRELRPAGAVPVRAA